MSSPSLTSLEACMKSSWMDFLIAFACLLIMTIHISNESSENAFIQHDLIKKWSFSAVFTLPKLSCFPSNCSDHEAIHLFMIILLQRIRTKIDKWLSKRNRPMKAQKVWTFGSWVLIGFLTERMPVEFFHGWVDKHRTLTEKTCYDILICIQAQYVGIIYITLFLFSLI